MPRLSNEVQAAVQSYGAIVKWSSLPSFNSQIYVEPFNVQHYAKGEGYPVWHSEYNTTSPHNLRHLVWMLYLNDVPNGGTEFLYQDEVLQAEKGKMVIWPAYFTHTHRGIISATHEKYIATGWVSHK